MSFKEIEIESKPAPPLVIAKGKQNPVLAQFPSNRSESKDAGLSTDLNALYMNGLIFTAYEYSNRSSSTLRDFRDLHNNHVTSLFDKNKRYNFNTNSIANILMPRSQTDIDNISHKFNDVQDSLQTRAGSIGSNVLSNIASTSLFGAIESVTQGAMADFGEQLHTTARSMYAGAENRVKVFSWQLTPRTVHDLIEIIKIYEIFAYYSYGNIGVSGFAKELKEKIDNWYSETILRSVGLEDQRDESIIPRITNFLSNVITVSNPVIWNIQNFGKSSKFDQRSDIFGPAQISNIRFDKSPDGQFRGLSIAPNLPSSFMLEVTFREILTLNRSNIFNKGFE